MTSTILRPGRDIPPVVLNAVLRQDLASFIRKSATTLSPGTPFIGNWHIQAIAWHLDQVRRGAIRRLIINMPPRSLKSISASVAFPAYVLGHDPTQRIICVSYASDLAVKHANDFRAIVEAPWYRQAFPLMRVAGKNSETEVATTRHGLRLATSIGGTLTGRGGNLIVIDDPLKPQDGSSEAKRQAANLWYRNTLLSRLDDKRAGAIVIVMKRIHMDDLTGFVTAGSDEWTVLTLSAIAEEDERVQIGDKRWHVRRVGDVLHPAREPLEELERMRGALGSDLFSAQYQQAPVPEGGAMIKRGWVRRYDAPPPRTYATRVIQSWDTASKAGPENDWSVCTTWQQENGIYYLLDVERGRYDFPTLRSRVLSLKERWKPTRILIEDTAAGTGLIQDLGRHGCHAIPVKPERDKVARMSIQTGKFEAGQIYLPVSAPWLAVFEAELFAFPGSKHDDQVDSVSQALGRHGPFYDTSMSWVT
jgi:predicted phage terminase large subunit-like protein